MGVSRISKNIKKKHKAGQGDMIDTWDLKVVKKRSRECEKLPLRKEL
jgi:hypothetical protein